MKKITLLFAAFLTAISIYAQDVTGSWYGVLKIQDSQMRIAFNVTKTDSGYSSTMDSPDQKALGIPVTSTTFSNNVLKFEVKNAKIEYAGTLDKNNIVTGTFKQGPQSIDVNLSREKIEKEKLVRPQEPVKPYPYYSEEVTFENKKDGITLAGTLTLPKQEGNFPVVVLITGSGPQNRDEEILGHKPFLVLADFLTRNGIGVLRYDDRGTASSKGDFKTATSYDFSVDAEAAVNYLLTRKEINKKKIGLMGHSEGGVIAPMIAARSKDVSFIVLLAGTGIRGDKLLLLQSELIGKVSGLTDADLQKALAINKAAYDIVVKSTDQEKLKADLTAYFLKLSKENADFKKPAGMTDEQAISIPVKQLSSAWMQYFIKYDPATALEKVKCAVLAVNGEKDLQVPPKEDLEAIKKALTKGGNKKFSTKELPNLNHLFQECKTGGPDEYSKIEQTISPTALTEILTWLQKQVK